MVLLQPSVASLIFCLVVQSIIECRILNVPSITVGPFLPSVLSGNKIHIQRTPMQLSSPPAYVVVHMISLYVAPISRFRITAPCHVF